MPRFYANVRVIMLTDVEAKADSLNEAKQRIEENIWESLKKMEGFDKHVFIDRVRCEDK